MRNTRKSDRVASTGLVMALVFAGAIQAVGTEEPGAGDTGPSAPTVLTAKDALKAMKGMIGYYRKEPTGDVFLYPTMKVEEGMYGMYGTYHVTPEGILLRPGGANGIAMAESAMGGASGTYRITPNGQAFFYPAAE